MKNFLKVCIIIIFSSVIFLLGILKVNASSSSSLYAYYNNQYNTHMEWVYNTSNNYIYSLINYDSNNGIYSYSNNIVLFYIDNINNNVDKISIRFYLSNNNNVILQNTNQNNAWRGLNFNTDNSSINITKFYMIEYYYNVSNNKYYSDINLTNEITTLSDDLITWNSDNCWVQMTTYCKQILHTTTAEQNVPFNIYLNNFVLTTEGVTSSRNYKLYNLNDEALHTYTNNEILPSYISEFHALPDYLSGYKLVNIPVNEQHFLLSGLSFGSVYFPLQHVIDVGGGLTYFNGTIPIPWDATIENYTNTPDGLYARFDFNLNNYYNSFAVLVSKYNYLEGEDSYSINIYVPNDAYISYFNTTYNNGVYIRDYTYKDINTGDINSSSSSEVVGDIYSSVPFIDDFFKNYSNNTFGLTSIITSPLNLINNLNSSSCSSLNIPIPFTNSFLDLPCMYDIYSSVLGSFFDIYQMITFGLISYWVIIRVLNMVKDFKSPDHDEIEVLDL